jgi:pectate lyase
MVHSPLQKRGTLTRFVLFGSMPWLLACSISPAGSADNNDKAPTGTASAGTSAINEPDPRSYDKPAFAAAIGFGAKSQGGRGGKIIAVSTLADAGPGTLRACIAASGPRVCVFRVSGVIRFVGRPPVISNSFITLAGQTAPGGGITLAHSGAVGGRTPLVVKNTHDVIIRHIRVRNDLIGELRGSEDSVTVENSSFVVFDHVSASWARDELVNGYSDNDYITVSNSIFAWGIPRHDKCALLASHPADPQHFSFIGNICAHSGDRNPDVNFPPGSCVEVINNVFYNAQSEFAEVWETWGGTPVSLVGNSFIAGPNTMRKAVGIVRQTVGSKGAASIYMSDNAFSGQFIQVAPSTASHVRPAPPCPLTVNPMQAAAGYAAVLKKAGAWPRDSLDRQVVDDVRLRRGRIVQAPGTIPPIANAAPYPDKDGDGMDDRWEAANGADPGKFDAWADQDQDGTSNLEAYLDHLDAALVGQDRQGRR